MTNLFLIFVLSAMIGTIVLFVTLIAFQKVKEYIQKVARREVDVSLLLLDVEEARRQVARQQRR